MRDHHRSENKKGTPNHGGNSGVLRLRANTMRLVRDGNRLLEDRSDDEPLVRAPTFQPRGRITTYSQRRPPRSELMGACHTPPNGRDASALQH